MENFRDNNKEKKQNFYTKKEGKKIESNKYIRSNTDIFNTY